IGEGRSIYLSQRGAGSPTVIFESGISATSLNWTHLQSTVSAFTRAIAYDRAGLGWSSPSTSERTPSNIVRELRLLLERAGIPPPYILVGHSFGGVVVRRFAIDHPAEVAGLVLVDPMRPEEWSGKNAARHEELNQGMLLAKVGLPCAHLGLARLALTSLLTGSGRVVRILRRVTGAYGQRGFDRLTCEVGKMPPETRSIVAAHLSSPHFYRGMAAHLKAVPATVLEMQEAKPIEEIPIVLLTPPTTELLSADAVQRIGPSTQQLLAEKSGHWIHLDEPSLVLDAIRKMVEHTRSNTPAPVEAFPP
ncbi:MAG: alpha/beta hydrolase, partial [Edaphobacter sp.]